MNKNSLGIIKICFFCCLLTGLFIIPAFSQNAQKLYSKGIEYQEEHNWYLASEKFQEAVRENPNYTEAWFHLAQCYYEMNESDLAFEYVSNAEKFSNGKTDIQNLKALILISLNKLPEAENIFNEILKKNPNDIEARFGLAQLAIFKGRVSGAETIYIDALRRDGQNVKALLSLALVSASLGKTAAAQKYINQALQSHSGNEEVYYIASYLAFRRGNLKEAEKRCLSAIQINENYSDAYDLLSLIMYAQKRYSDVIDIADFTILKDRNKSLAWYMKGLSLEKLGRFEEAIAVWTGGLEVQADDEIMRSAFELLVSDNIKLEDSRRADWAMHHVKKADDYAKKYAGSLMRYEYQTALRLNPKDYKARRSFSNLLRNDGFNELYLEQLHFIQDNDILSEGIQAYRNQGKNITDNDRDIAIVRLSDTIEGLSSLLEGTIAAKWNINPFYLDKTRWTIGIYYLDTAEPIPHPELARIAAGNLSSLFKGVLGTSVSSYFENTSGYGNAYLDAHKRGCDYFVILSADETDRDLKFDAVMYSGRTGTETQKFSVFKTGNDRYVNSILRLRRSILEMLPVRARLLERSGRDVLVDIGKTEAVNNGAKFAVVKKGAVKTKDTGAGLSFTQDMLLGYVTLTNVSEEISEGILSDTGFYDRVNAGDELILVSLGEDEKEVSQAASDTSPQADADGKTVNENPLRGADIEAARTPSLINMIRKLY